MEENIMKNKLFLLYSLAALAAALFQFALLHTAQNGVFAQAALWLATGAAIFAVCLHRQQARSRARAYTRKFFAPPENMQWRPAAFSCSTPFSHSARVQAK